MDMFSKTIFYNIDTLNRSKKLEVIFIKIIFFIIIASFIYILFVAFNIYSFSHINELVNADVAIILGASVWNDKPSPVFQERINHGVWLYKNNYVKYLIFTGGIGKGSDVSEAFVAMNFAIKNSVPIENIFIEEKSRITIENILYAKYIIQDNNFDKIIIVSDPLHMKRATTIAKDFNLNIYSSPTPTTKYTSFKTKLSFLFYELFFYIIYKIYKYSFFISLYLITFGFLFLIYRHNCA
jgi:uncharacterized SAM-binding protein YcdF (DUF218 family)